MKRNSIKREGKAKVKRSRSLRKKAEEYRRTKKPEKPLSSPHKDGLLRLAHLPRGGQGMEVSPAGGAEEDVLAAVVPGEGVVLEVLKGPHRPAIHHQEGITRTSYPPDVGRSSRIQVAGADLGMHGRA